MVANDENRWASNPLNDDSIAVIEAVEKAITVDLIATFESQLVCCAPLYIVDDLVSSDAHKRFDFLPVRRDDRIVGLLALHEHRQAHIPDSGRTVETAMMRLDQSILIAAGTRILHYIEEISPQHPCRLVMWGTRIAGIVTISHLTKLPVCPAIFLLVTHLELLMEGRHSRRFQGRPDEEWLAHVGERRDVLQSRWETLKSQGLDIDLLGASYLADKREIVLKICELPGSRKKAKRGLHEIEKLRDSLAHASDYAPTMAKALATSGGNKSRANMDHAFSRHAQEYDDAIGDKRSHLIARHRPHEAPLILTE